MDEQVVDIDVPTNKLGVSIASGDKIKIKTVNNTAARHVELDWWLSSRDLLARTLIVLEATGLHSEAVAMALSDVGRSINVFNLARISGCAQGKLSQNKTDNVDAKQLAKFVLRADLDRWEPPSDAGRKRCALVDRLRALIELLHQEYNRPKAIPGSIPLNIKTMLEEHIAWLDEPMDRIQPDIDDHLDGNLKLEHDAELMRSIPGIDSRVSAQLLAYIGGVQRFKNVKASAAFIGVTPEQKQSGTSINGRTTTLRTGHSAARKSPYLPGMAAKRDNPLIIALAKRLEQCRLASKAIVGTSIRKLMQPICCVVISGRPSQAAIPMAGLEIQEGA